MDSDYFQISDKLLNYLYLNKNEALIKKYKPDGSNVDPLLLSEKFHLITNQIKKNNCNEILYNLLMYKANLNTIKYLFEQNLEFNFDEELLLALSITNNIEIVKYIKEKYNNITWETLFNGACKEKSIKPYMLKYILDNCDHNKINFKELLRISFRNHNNKLILFFFDKVNELNEDLLGYYCNDYCNFKISVKVLKLFIDNT